MNEIFATLLKKLKKHEMNFFKLKKAQNSGFDFLQAYRRSVNEVEPPI